MLAPRFAIANIAGRAALVVGDRWVDLHTASAGALPWDPNAAPAHMPAIAELAASGCVPDDAPRFDPLAAGPPVPNPRQVFAIGLNYRDHAGEAGLPVPATPMVFTKFASSITGPTANIPLTSDRCDFEVELVAVVGRGGRQIPEHAALDHLAGFCIGQDISDRRLQFSDQPPQFSLGKSAEHFGPTGPVLTPTSQLSDPLDLAIECTVNGQTMQESRTSAMIFPVPRLVAYLSAHCELYPGDLIFTGTPHGVGAVRSPRCYLKPGDVICSGIEGLGELSNRCTGEEHRI